MSFPISILLVFSFLNVVEKTPLRFKALFSTENEGEGILLEIPSNGDYRIDVISSSPHVNLDTLPSFVIRGVRLLPAILPKGEGEVSIEYSTPLRWEERKRSKVFDDLLSTLVPNHIAIQEGRESEVYLVITPSLFLSELEPLVASRRYRGLDVVVVTLDEIGAEPEAIKNFLLDVYNNWERPPTYVLLVGDESLIPVYEIYDIGGCDTYMPWEGYYATLDGDDYVEDVFLGRLAVNSKDNLKRVIEKILLFEERPFTSDSLWLRKAILLSGDEYEPDTVYIAAKETVRVVLDSMGIISDTFYMRPEPPYPTGPMVIVSLDEGCQFLNFRGNAGGSFFPPFQDVIPQNVLNYNKPFFFMAVSCEMLKFNSTYSPSKAWLSIGDPGVTRGAFGLFGTAGCVFGEPGNQYLHSLRRNALDVGFFKGFRGGIRELGPLSLYSKLYLIENYPQPDTWAEYHYKEALLLGDPALAVYGSLPASLQVEFSEEPTFGQNNLTIQVMESGIPVGGATVTIMDKRELLFSGETDSSGTVITSFWVDEGPVVVSVYKYDHIPYLKKYALSQPSSGVPVIVGLTAFDSSGYSDGYLNPGEETYISFNVTNMGLSPILELEGVVDSANNLVAFDSAFSCGTIGTGDTVLSTLFMVHVEDSLLNGDTVSFFLTLNAYQNTFELRYDVEVRWPEFSIDSVLILDTGQDGFLDPGDTAILLPYICNSGGTSLLDTLKIRLEISGDPWITLMDSTAYLVGLAAGGAGAPGDSLILLVSPDCPEGYTAELYFILTWLGEVDTFNFDFRVGGRDFLVFDPIQNDPGYIIYSVLSDSLGFEGYYLKSLTPYLTKLNAFPVIFISLGARPYLYKLQEEEVVSLISYLSNGGAVYIEGSNIISDSLALPLLQFIGVGFGGEAQSPDRVSGYPNTYFEGLHFHYVSGYGMTDRLTGTANTYPVLRGIAMTGFYTVGLARDSVFKAVVSTAEIRRLWRLYPSENTLTEYLDTLIHFLSPALGLGENQKDKISGLSIQFTSNPIILSGKIIINGEDSYRINLYDITGRKRFSFEGKGHLTLTMPPDRSFSSGIYFLELLTPKRRILRKVVFLR